MTYISLYRKYRSQKFDELVGQEAIVSTIKNAINNNRLAHAYLFTGPRGTGKTSMARIFAKALNCTDKKDSNPCGVCDQCTKITNGFAMNVMEIDAASNRGIDEIRDLREKIKYKPVEGKYKVYIIDEVHMLTNEAFNALLKTLEEPPDDTVFLLATTEPQKVPVTISSRCQRFDFGRISLQKVVEHLKEVTSKEDVKIDEKALGLVARASEGSMRDALSLIDQLIAFCGNEIKADDVVTVLGTAEPEFIFEMGQALLQKKESAVMPLMEKAVMEGVGAVQLTRDLTMHLRNMMFAKISCSDLLELPDEQIKRLEADSGSFSLDEIKNAVRILSEGEAEMRWHHNQKMLLEIALMEIMSNKYTAPKIETAPKAPSVLISAPQTVSQPASQKVSQPVPQTVAQPVPQPVVPAAKIQDEPRKEVRVITDTPELSVVKEKWRNVLEKMKTFSPMGYGCLTEAGGLEINAAGKLRLSFKKGFSFHKMRIEDSTNRTALEGFIREVTGFNLSVECAMSDGDEQAFPVPPALPKVTVSNPEPVALVADKVTVAAPAPAKVSLDEVLEMFDGSVVK